MEKNKKGRPKSAPINNEIGKRIKSARTISGLTQKALSDYLNVSIDTVRGWENSRHLPEKVGVYEAIASACNVSVDWLQCKDVPTVVQETLAMANSTIWCEDKPTSLREEFRTYALIYSLQMCGYSLEDIRNKSQYCEYMESSIRNSIEFYMTNLNRQKG